MCSLVTRQGLAYIGQKMAPGGKGLPGSVYQMSLPALSEADLKQVLENTKESDRFSKRGSAADSVSLKKVLGLDEHFDTDEFCHALKRLTGGVPRAVAYALISMLGKHLPTIRKFQGPDKAEATKKLVEWMTTGERPIHMLMPANESPVYREVFSQVAGWLEAADTRNYVDLIMEAFFLSVLGRFMPRSTAISVTAADGSTQQLLYEVIFNRLGFHLDIDSSSKSFRVEFPLPTIRTLLKKKLPTFFNHMLQSFLVEEGDRLELFGTAALMLRCFASSKRAKPQPLFSASAFEQVDHLQGLSLSVSILPKVEYGIQVETKESVRDCWLGLEIG